MSQAQKISTLYLICLILVVGCNDGKSESLLNILGKKEAEIRTIWGEPIETSGKDFSFYEPYSSKPKSLFYRRQNKDIVVHIKEGIVVGISLVPPYGEETSAGTTN